MQKPLVMVIIGLAVAGGGLYYYASTQEAIAPATQEFTENTPMGGALAGYSGAVLAGSVTPLLDFNERDYQQALASDKLVVLYFYADWCPTCKTEVENALYPAFNELQDPNVIGFRVNYNDPKTDDNERQLAREYGVAYQHTKVLVKNGQRVLKSPESWDKARYFSEISVY